MSESWFMPHEGDQHERCWMAWPSGGYTLGETSADADEARDTWAAVANAIAQCEPLTMVIEPDDLPIARRLLDGQIEFLEAPLDDAWMRDIGPTFVTRTREDGARELGAVNWIFNGWGVQSWARWERDAKIGALVAEAAGATRIDSPLVNEGGGIHVDGRGTVLLTESVQLGEGRNPELTHAEVEAEMLRTIGARHAIWLPRGLWRDSQEFGTRGHVDIVAAFPSPGCVLLHEQRHPAHPDYALTRELRELLAEAHDVDGNPLEVISLPAPHILEDSEGWVDYSYVNHLVCNGAVISCAFDDPADAEAREVLAAAYPGREILAVDARPLYARGGGIHCITQQQPALGQRLAVN